MYHNAFFESLRVTRRAALSRAIAERPDRAAWRRRARRRRRHRAAVRNRARQRPRRRILEPGRPGRRRGCTRTTKRRGWRSAGWRCWRDEPDTPATRRRRARPADDLRPGDQDQPGLRRAGSRRAPTRGRASCAGRSRIRRASSPSSSACRRTTSSRARSASRTTSRWRCWTLFERLGDPHLQMIGEWSRRRRAVPSRRRSKPRTQHLERGLALYDPAFHGPRVWQTGIEPGIFCRCELLADADPARVSRPGAGRGAARRSRDARAIDHPQPLAFALLFEIFAHLARAHAARGPAHLRAARGRLPRARHRAGAAVGRAALRPRAHRARRFETRAAGHRGRPAAHTMTRSALLRPYYLVMFAGALLRAGTRPRAARRSTSPHARADATGQHAYDAEHARLQAELISARGGSADDAEASIDRRSTTAAAPGCTLARAARRPRLRAFPREPPAASRGARGARADSRLAEGRLHHARLRLRRRAVQDAVTRCGTSARQST